MVNTHRYRAYRLTDLKETLAKLKQQPCKIIAGGTDVMVLHKSLKGQLPSMNQDIVFINHLQ